MNRHNDNTSRFGNLLQYLDNLESGGTVQTGGRLVEKQNDRIVNYIRADGNAPLLPAGDTAVGFVTDNSVGGGSEP